MRDHRRRVIVFALFSVLCVGVACLYAVYAAHRGATDGAPTGIRVVELSGDGPLGPSTGRVLFRNTALGSGYGKVALSGVASGEPVRYVTGLECDRVDFAGGAGSCLTAERGVFTTYRALIFDERFNVRHTIALQGIPSRTRVSPDGRLAAVTVFVSGHSYAGGAFSTLTTLIDTTTGGVIADLEQFAVVRDRKPFKKIDFNFWGVTFAADSNTFYATLGTGGDVLLVRGDAAARSIVVLRSGVECPSLSPDGTRLGFKKRETKNGQVLWRLATLDLATLTDKLVNGEVRSVDDQVEWLDDRHLLYSLSDDELGLGGTTVWAVDVDGQGPSTSWLRGAYSPSVVSPVAK